MSEIDYPNIKLKFVSVVFGPLIKWVEYYHITGAFIGLALYSILLYFFFLRKKKRIDWYGWFAVICWLAILFLTIKLQFQLIQGPSEYPLLPDRVRVRLEKYEQEKRAKVDYRVKEEKKK